MSRSAEDRNDGASGRSRDGTSPRARRTIKFALAIIAALGSFFLAWPWWRDYSYWAESQTMWKIYFATGFVLAVYVVYVFLGNMRTLFEHDAIERAELAEQAGSDDMEDRP